MEKSNNSSLQEMISNIKLMRKGKLIKNWEDSSAIYNLFSTKFSKKTFCPIIINWNVNSINKKKFEFLQDKIYNFKPDIIFLSECWIKPMNIPTFTKFSSNDCYQNTLYIKTDKLRNKSVVPIDRGFLFEDLCFRYVPPQSKYISLRENEIGDYNFYSNTWVNAYNFNKEKRKTDVGGLGSKLKYSHEVKFLDSPSDHNIEIIKINENWKKILQVDMRKLENALESAITNGKLEYFYSDRSVKRKRINSRIVNPNTFDIQDWIDIYGQDNTPKLPHKHIIGNKTITESFGTFAYDADDIPLKPITKFIKKKKLNLSQLQNLVNVLQKYPSIGRIVTILKQKHKLESIKDIRPICILPVAMRITEQTRRDLCNLPTSNFIYGFKPQSSVHNLFANFFKEFNYIIDNDIY